MIPEWNSFINGNCMDYLKEFPDNYFSLALVDPPYGGGLCENGGCMGRWAKYHQTPENIGGVEPSITGSAAMALGSKSIRTNFTNGIRKSSKSYQERLEKDKIQAKK